MTCRTKVFLGQSSLYYAQASLPPSAGSRPAKAHPCPRPSLAASRGWPPVCPAAKRIRAHNGVVRLPCLNRQVAFYKVHTGWVPQHPHLVTSLTESLSKVPARSPPAILKWTRTCTDLCLVCGVALVELQLHVVALLHSGHDALADVLDVQVEQSPGSRQKGKRYGCKWMRTGRHTHKVFVSYRCTSRGAPKPCCSFKEKARQVLGYIFYPRQTKHSSLRKVAVWTSPILVELVANPLLVASPGSNRLQARHRYFHVCHWRLQTTFHFDSHPTRHQHGGGIAPTAYLVSYGLKMLVFRSEGYISGQFEETDSGSKGNYSHAALLRKHFRATCNMPCKRLDMASIKAAK